METTASFSAGPRLPLTRFPAKLSYSHLNKLHIRKLVLNAKQGESDDNEESGDEKYFLRLRMRMKKRKVLEAATDYQDQAKIISSSLDHQSKSERKQLYSLLYDEEVLEALIELLRLCLMKNRLHVALGVVALVAISIPLSQSVFFANALKVAKVLMAEGHICIDIDF